MMYLLRKYDVARFTRNDAMFAQCAVRHTSFAKRTSLGEAVIICRKANIIPKIKASRKTCFYFWRRHPESNRGIKVLQTSALPLGYGAVSSRPQATLFQCSDVLCHSAGHQYINRQPLGCPAYKNQRARICFVPVTFLERITGIEPATSTLARSRSTK